MALRIAPHNVFLDPRTHCSSTLALAPVVAAQVVADDDVHIALGDATSRKELRRESRIASSGTGHSIAGEDRCEISGASFEIDSVAAIHEMERLGPQNADDFSVLRSHSFRMAGEQD